MTSDIADVAAQLAVHAEAVCRRYLPAGKREGRQWRVGDVRNKPGRSLYVRLAGPASGRDAAGRWRDLATGEGGDLIDLIRLSRQLPNFAEALDEARRFLNLPQRFLKPGAEASHPQGRRYDPMSSIRRLRAESSGLVGSLAQTYLRHRGIHHDVDLDKLRFHAKCPYRDPATGRFSHWPAMLALVTDLDGALIGLQRTYLSPEGDDKAPVSAPRRSLGTIRQHGVRFGVIDDLAIVGEGVETMLSLKGVLPTVPMVAALSADNLGIIALPPTLRRLYVATDRDAAGRRGSALLLARAHSAGIDARPILPVCDDFNTDLNQLGLNALQSRISRQLHAADLRKLVR